MAARGTISRRGGGAASFCDFGKRLSQRLSACLVHNIKVTRTVTFLFRILFLAEQKARRSTDPIKQGHVVATRRRQMAESSLMNIAVRLRLSAVVRMERVIGAVSLRNSVVGS